MDLIEMRETFEARVVMRFLSLLTQEGVEWTTYTMKWSLLEITAHYRKIWPAHYDRANSEVIANDARARMLG